MNKLALHSVRYIVMTKSGKSLYKNETWEKDTNKANTKQLINQLCSKQVQSIGMLVKNPEEYVDMVQQCSSVLNEKKIMKDICDIAYVKEPPELDGDNNFADED